VGIAGRGVDLDGFEAGAELGAEAIEARLLAEDVVGEAEVEEL
jgi:hypothetical protein